MESNSPIMLSVHWRDATSVDEWTFPVDIEHRCNIIHSVGILVNETKDLITLALNHDTDSSALSCFIVIPKVWLVSRKVLIEKKKRSSRKND